MSSITSNIVPVSNVITVTYSGISIACTRLDLFKGASFYATLLDSSGNMVKNTTQPVSITQEEYSQWNNDDEYIVNLIATKLGYTIAP
jgi:hypothetical protein